MKEKLSINTLSVGDFTSLIQTVTSQAGDAILLSQREVRSRFEPQMSRMTLYRWTKAGKLPMTRLMGYTFFKLSDVVRICKATGNRYTLKSDSGQDQLGPAHKNIS